jgi:NADH-quinone oxidoreductase subunit M
MKFPILSVIIFTPLLGSILVLLFKSHQERLMKQVGLLSTIIPLILSIIVLVQFRPGGGMQFVEKVTWSKTIGASYYLGVDGIGLPMFFMTALLTFLAYLASWNTTLRPKGYFSLLLLLEVGMLGVFVALDFILFYIFWELVLLPMYFLIGIWGGERREYAAIKFFLYTLAGSVFMLLGILALYFQADVRTFDMVALTEQSFPFAFQRLVFWGFYLGFAVKVPIFPFHTWLPDAHVEAPTAVSVLLAGILLKMGTYGFLRVLLPMLPHSARYYATMLAVLGVINIIYGALNSMVQNDLKKMVAYSSVSHMGYVMLGIGSLTAIGMNGALIQMFSHAAITGMLFLLVGYIYERTHTRQISEMGGLLNKIPLLAGILSFAAFASMALPGLSGFVGEFLVLVGAFLTKRVWAIIGATGVIITAGYLLWMLQRVVMGTLPEKFSNLVDVNKRELVTLVPLMALILIIGLYPESILFFINRSIVGLVAMVGFG